MGTQFDTVVLMREGEGCIMSSLGAPGQQSGLPVAWNKDLAEHIMLNTVLLYIIPA